MFRLIATGFAVATAFAAPSFAASFNTLSGEAPLVIAHRGASGYLPEHTLAAYELAIQMGADIVEPDLQTTKDGYLVAMHDSWLARTTNVETVLGERNGSYNVSEYTLAEIKTLTVETSAGNTYPGYTPSMAEPFKVPTFQEVMDLVKAHNTATGDKIGVYPEAKVPSAETMNRQILTEMQANGFTTREDNSFVQTFSAQGAADLAAIQDELGMDNQIAVLGYAQVTAEGFGVYDYPTGTINALADLALFADGVGVNLGSLTSEFIVAAHDLGLAVHGWTFNQSTEEDALASQQAWIDAGMDGLFTNYTDLTRAIVDANVSAVPLPAGLPLMLAGVGSLAVIRRRRKAA